MSNLPPIPDNSGGWRVTRRGMGKAGAAALAAQAVGVQAQPTMPQPQPTSAASAAATPTLIDVRLTVNGREQAITVDSRTTLLDALREHLALDRHQEGLRPRPVRRLHRARRRAAHQRLPDAGGDARRRRRSPPSRAWARRRHAAPDAGRLRQARRLPVRLLHARPDLLGGRHARARSRAGMPSHVTRRSAAAATRADGRGDSASA